MRLFIFLLILLLTQSCRSSEVVKPKTHKVWPKGNKYVIDVPVGNRHIRLFERKRTKNVRMH